MIDDQKGILRTLYVTEKTQMLQNLVEKESNKSIKSFSSHKYVFLVHPRSKKYEIKKMIESCYFCGESSVLKINTIVMPRKKKRGRRRSAAGETALVKKAVVTLKPGKDIVFA